MSVSARFKDPAFVPFTQRVASALVLREALYEYAANTPTAMAQAIAVVCFAGMAQPSTLTKEFAAWGMIASMLLALFRWFMFATFIAYPTTRLLTWSRVEYKRLLRCLGFAEAPGLLNLFAWLSNEPLPEWTNVLIWLWLLAATIAALRAALSLTYARATVIGIVIFLLYLGVGFVNALIIALPTP